jgi:predicted nicotinamide N-methyase
MTWRTIMICSAEPEPWTLEIIRTSTRLSSVPLVPEIRLHQASEPVSLWERTELAAGRTGLDPPFWAFAWAGGQALARYLLDHPETARGRRAIDIASGSGLVAIAAARAGAAAVTAYDVDPLAAAAITVNTGANGVSVRAACADVLGEDGAPCPDTDLVLAADAFYERDLAGRVIRFLERAHTRGVAVLIGDFGRAYLPRDRLTPLATYDVPGLRALEDSDIKRTTIWAPLMASRPGEFTVRNEDHGGASLPERRSPVRYRCQQARPAGGKHESDVPLKGHGHRRNRSC